MVILLLGQESAAYQRVRVAIGTPLDDIVSLADADSRQHGDARRRSTVDIDQVASVTLFAAVHTIFDTLRDRIYAIDGVRSSDFGIGSELLCAFLEVSGRVS